MISGVFSPTLPSFKKLRFRAGLNIVLVNRTETSGAGAKRNGAGKSSLLDVIHFLLGGAAKEARSPLSASELVDQAFALTFSLADKPVTVTRSLATPGTIDILGEYSHWPVPPDVAEDGTVTMTEDAWRDLLGRTMFGLQPASQERGSWVSFRSCFPYFARRQRNDGYFDWRKHVGQQRAVAWQAPLAYMLGLDREGILELHRVKDAEKEKVQLTRLLRSNLIQESLGSPAKLRTQANRLGKQIAKLETQLSGFQVVSAYDDLVEQANDLQIQIEEITNSTFLDLEIASNLEKSLADERPPELTDLQRVYSEAGVVLPGLSLARYEQVEQFHKAVLSNRRLHLQAELNDARGRIDSRRSLVAQAQHQRNRILETINSGGPSHIIGRWMRNLLDCAPSKRH